MAYDDDDQVDKQQEPPHSPLQEEEEEEGRLAGWADLPEELFISIITVFQQGLDFWEICQCGRVCRRWESILRDNLAMPVLLCIQHCISLAPPAPQDTLADYARLITEPEVAYKVDHTRPCKQPYNIFCVEISVDYPINSLISHHGWLFLSSDTLFPPKLLLCGSISKATIQLPSAPYIEAIKYATSSAPPVLSDFTVLACFTTEPGFCAFMYCKPSRDKRWKPIRAACSQQTWVDDMIFYNGDFYAVNFCGMLQRFMLGLNAPRVDELPTRTMEEEVSLPGSSRTSRYLVQSLQGELLMVSRVSTDINDKTTRRTCLIRVFKMDWKKHYWETVSRFEDGETLFLAHFDSMFVSSCNDYRSNCVYFFDDHHEEHSSFNSGGCDFGVYNMEDQTFEYVLPSEQMRSAWYFRWFNPCL